MSLLLGLIDPHADRSTETEAARMLTRVAPPEWQSAIWTDAGVALGVARPDWAFKAGFAGPVFVVADEETFVVADATLYYRDDLRKRLLDRRIRPKGQTPSHLIAAAYRAWGDRCAEYLEGDFAFVLWDRRAKQLLAARDFGGRRPLHYSELPGGGIAFASSIDALIAHPRCSSALDLTVIAESTAAYVRPGGATCYSSVKRLEIGHTAVCGIHRGLRTVAHWTPPIFEQGSSMSLDDAAGELRSLLARAVSERLDSHGPTAVWMSGGRDSTAVFASAMAGRDARAGDGSVFPLSISYPVGDPGREDEYIQSVARRWNAEVRWVHIGSIPLLDQIAERAHGREEPFAHIFESPLRALSIAGERLGASVALDGVGGDQLFSVSWVYLSDLLRSGRWGSLAKEWRDGGFGGSGFRTFVRWAVQPSAPTWLLYTAGAFRGGPPLRGELRRRLPEWVNPAFARLHAMSVHSRTLPRRLRGESTSSAESRWYLTDPVFPAIHRRLARIALAEGVEVRSPLMDGRVLDFAATRPREERCSGGRTKLLLRAAMRGLVPDEVLAERELRTGVTGGYFANALREAHDSLMLPAFRSPRLADLGVIDPAALLRACERYAATADEELGLRLLLTLHAELWLRSHGSPPFAEMKNPVALSTAS